VVFDDADMDGAVEGLVDAIWFNQGQVCCAGSRLLVQESIEQPFLKKVRARMAKLRVGDPLDKAIDIGAIVAPSQLARIESLVEAGRAAGAEVWQPPDACPTDGWFYPPTLVTRVGPASELAQVEVFGPVLVSMSFRTPSEAIVLANNTRYGLAASVWSQDIEQALDVARGIQAGTVWINSTNLFDASSGFGGYRESGFGREGGREGLFEYVKHIPTARANPVGDFGGERWSPAPNGEALPAIDRTPKMYIGGKQARPDSGYSQFVYGSSGEILGEVGDGNRKDIRNAVEAAHAAFGGWSGTTAYNRAQVLYYVAENLAARASEFSTRLQQMTGQPGHEEVERAIEALFTWAAYADKYEGSVHLPPLRGATLAVPEPIGVIGLACPTGSPLLGLVNLIGPLLAMGNTVVAIPSQAHPLGATDLYQVFDTSDVPGGVVNIVTGARDALALVLAEHDDVDAVWYVGTPEGRREVEAASVGNMKRTWTHLESDFDVRRLHAEEALREAVHIKNIWVIHSI
jgi:aldehyde dehydrogenase (NAD+)